MNWIALTSNQQLLNIQELSYERPQVIFKHSTRCSISSMVLTRLEKSYQPSEADFYFLDLIAYRNISNQVAELFDVWHESPQIIVIKEGKCVYDESHMGITMKEILENVAA